MGKKRKGKSVKNNSDVYKEPDSLVNAPHSFVIHKGLPGGHVEALTRDFRRVMEPFTASALREKRNNSVKDFVHVAGILHVTHMCIFSRTDVGSYLKLGKIPRGPTLTFKIHNFTLAKDVVTSLKKQLVPEKAFKSSPLIVLNNFSGEGLHFKLMASMFQNMFPTLNLYTVDLNTVRRVVMLNYNSETKLIDFRHYTIKILPAGVSRGVKKVVTGRIPNLAKCEDISEFLTKGVNLSESEAEDDPNAHVTLPQKVTMRGNIQDGKSAIRLTELGPRLTLQLMKIEEGLMDGEVLYHNLLQKSEKEKAAIKKSYEEKKRLKEKRKKVQEENKMRKEAHKEKLKEKCLQGMKKIDDVEEPEEAESSKARAKKRSHERDENEVEEDDDAQYYRDEVGEEPDKDLFTSKTTGFKRPPKTFHAFKNKKPRFDDTAKSHSSKNGKTFTNKTKFGTRNKKGGEKTNATNRDFRPIGMKSGIRKFGSSKPRGPPKKGRK